MKNFLLFLLIIPSICLAQKSKHGDWWTDSNGKYMQAYTLNESGAALGVICSEYCIYYANLLAKCNVGNSYNALLSTENGATPIRAKCEIIDDRYLLTLQTNADITASLYGAQTAGIAIPLEDGRFSVARFSLFGSDEAVIPPKKAST